MKALLCLGLLVPFSWAQEAQPQKHLRFVPLGEMPPHQEKIENGVRVHLPPPPGTVPPKPTTLALDPKEGGEVILRLKEFTKLSSIKSTAGGVKLFEGKILGGKPWISSPFPSGNHTLGILYRDLKKMDWFNPVMKIVPDDLGSFPLGTVRFVNVSQYPALVKVGDEKSVRINPGNHLIKTLKVGDTAMLVGYEPTKGGPEIIFKNNFNLKPKQRIQAFLYKAQGKNPRKEVRLFHHPESFTPPPKRKKAPAVAGG
ncbi:hypothetical protein N9A94_08750 [Akkermansiaceae bacterium]|nr:hypothetical protein [Akkermansiaceae bacterium]MDA7888122.1 hypothetical protein [Akkermansiaceae bacterium]MDB4537048.1 hypothetical protein [Akkermansiaceae bacterium]MDB4544560.1 hypothetical protein [Akkermansiaceae bacterium]